MGHLLTSRTLEVAWSSTSSDVWFGARFPAGCGSAAKPSWPSSRVTVPVACAVTHHEVAPLGHADQVVEGTVGAREDDDLVPERKV